MLALGCKRLREIPKALAHSLRLRCLLERLHDRASSHSRPACSSASELSGWKGATDHAPVVDQTQDSAGTSDNAKCASLEFDPGRRADGAVRRAANGVTFRVATIACDPALQRLRPASSACNATAAARLGLIGAAGTRGASAITRDGLRVPGSTGLTPQAAGLEADVAATPAVTRPSPH
eukprot:5428294-Prymnesium_polylepis.4